MSLVIILSSKQTELSLNQKGCILIASIWWRDGKMPALKKIEWKSVYSRHEQSQNPLCGDGKTLDIAAPTQT